MPNTQTPSKNRGGRRPGAGAPRGNRNALKHGRNTAAARLLEGHSPFAAVFETLPPAARELFKLAVLNATTAALADFEIAPPEDPAVAHDQRLRLYFHTARLVLIRGGEAWGHRRSRDQQETALVRALAPWLTVPEPNVANAHAAARNQSRQSTPEPAEA